MTRAKDKFPRGTKAIEVAPELSAEWSSENDSPFSTYARGSEFKASWTGRCGHSWKASVRSRAINGTGCPYCNPKGRKWLLSGVNDLLTLDPDLSRHWSARNSKTPADVTPKSNDLAWWVCEVCGADWESSISSRSRTRNMKCRNCVRKGPRTPREGASLFDTHPSLAAEIILVDPKLVSRGTNVNAPWRCPEGHTWVASLSSRSGPSGRGCPTCWSRGRSGKEYQVFSFVNSLVPGAIQHDRSVLSGREVDILVPDKGLAIEFNGVHWHKERFKGRTGHLEKSLAAETAGVQLIHVWEDDWTYRRPVVEKMLARKLGVSQEERLNARSLRKERITYSEASDLLNNNHIQGSARGSEYLALSDDSGARAVLVMKRRTETEWELVRFGTNALVRGGHSRLFRWFLSEHPEVERVVTFADRGVSDGGLYETCGFAKDGELPPDYMYVVGDRRVHKFNYRKKRFRTDPRLKFEEGLTERELAELNRLDPIWDAGKIRFAWSR